MAVRETQAALIFTGRHADATAAAVTAALGLQPSYSHESGDPHQSARLATSGTTKESKWILREERTAGSDEDFHGMRSLDRLAERLEPYAESIRTLRTDYWVIVDLYASSDTSQGGFFVSQETMRRLGLLEVPFVPSVYCFDDEK